MWLYEQVCIHNHSQLWNITLVVWLSVGWATSSVDGDAFPASSTECDIRQPKLVHYNTVLRMQKKAAKATAVATRWR